MRPEFSARRSLLALEERLHRRVRRKLVRLFVGEPMTDAAAVHLHLGDCERCRTYFNALAATWVPASSVDGVDTVGASNPAPFVVRYTESVAVAMVRQTRPLRRNVLMMVAAALMLVLFIHPSARQSEIARDDTSLVARHPILARSTHGRGTPRDASYSFRVVCTASSGGQIAFQGRLAAAEALFCGNADELKFSYLARSGVRPLRYLTVLGVTREGVQVYSPLDGDDEATAGDVIRETQGEWYSGLETISIRDLGLLGRLRIHAVFSEVPFAPGVLEDYLAAREPDVDNPVLDLRGLVVANEHGHAVSLGSEDLGRYQTVSTPVEIFPGSIAISVSGETEPRR